MKLDTSKRELDSTWLAGVLDSFGEVGVLNKPNAPTIFAKFKSIYLDRLYEIQSAAGGLGALRGPFRPTGDARTPYYELVFRGSHLAQLENMIFPRMRTAKKTLFASMRDKARSLREHHGLKGPFPLCAVDEIANGESAS